MDKHINNKKKPRKQTLTQTYSLKEPTPILESGIEAISQEKSDSDVPLLKITPAVRQRAAHMMNAAGMSPKTADYCQKQVGHTQEILDDQDYVSTQNPEQLKTPTKKRRLHRPKEDQANVSKAPKSPAKPRQEVQEPFIDRLVQYVLANKQHITGLTMQSIPSNQWVSVNIKSEPEVIDLPDFGDLTNV